MPSCGVCPSVCHVWALYHITCDQKQYPKCFMFCGLSIRSAMRILSPLSGQCLLVCRSYHSGALEVAAVGINITYNIVWHYIITLLIIITDLWHYYMIDDKSESSMTDRLQAGRYSLQMSSWPGIVIPRWRTSSSSRIRVSKASAFRFVSRTVCSSYPTLNLRQPSFSSRRCTDLEQSSAAYHSCSVTSRLLLSLEDKLLRTLLPVITVVVPAKWHCHLWTC